MRLNSRLKSLENRIAPPAPRECSVCGLPLPGSGPIKVTVGWWSPDDPPEPQDQPCRACGQRRVIWIDFDRAG